jgi:hypothetical protein
LVTEDFAVVREASEGMEEGVSRFGFSPIGQLIRRETEGALDEGVYKGINFLDAVVERAAGDEFV